MAVYDINGNALTVTQEARRVRILEYNLGNFSDGGTTGYTGDDLDGYIADWATFIGNENADLCLFTESRRYVDSAGTALSKDRIYQPLFREEMEKYVASAGTWGWVLLSQNEQINPTWKQFAAQSSSASGYVGAMINLNGVNVYVVSVHFIHGGEPNYSIRAAQMAELVADVAQYENVIIGGDLNTHDLSYELDTLKDAGFTFANGGVFGTHTTFTTDANAPLDNVGIRGNALKLVGFNVMDTVTLSDHYPTATEILVG